MVFKPYLRAVGDGTLELLVPLAGVAVHVLPYCFHSEEDAANWLASRKGREQIMKIRGRRKPSREEWAIERRTPSFDRFPITSNSLGEYATPAEIAALEAALCKRWEQLGKTMRELNRGGQSEAGRNLRSDRNAIKWALALVVQGELPRHVETFSEAEDILAPFHKKYEAAKSKLHERALREIERTPIDDNAWALFQLGRSA
jgi:hypothetical protein